MTDKLIFAMEYAMNCHNSTNHLYAGHSYVLHLSMVVDVATRHIYLIPERSRENVLAACWLHDVIEDCRQSYNDVVAVAGKTVADIVYALSNEKGKNRHERANDKYYQGIKDTAWATFVKLCDRIANASYSKYKNYEMFLMYKKENAGFLSSLSPNPSLMPLINELDALFE